MSSAARVAKTAAILWIAVALPAAAQIDQRVDGRVLDANNQVGSGGFNPAQVRPAPNTGNLIMTGNVTGGRSFQAFSPIRDASTLFTTLPTAALGNFDRDSIGVADVRPGGSPLMASPFFLPSTTAARMGGPPLSAMQTSTGTPGRIFPGPRVNAFTGEVLSLDAGLNPSWAGPSAPAVDPRFLPRPTTAAPLANRSEPYQSRFSADSPIFASPWSTGSTQQDRPSVGLPGYPEYPPGTTEVAGAPGIETGYRSLRLARLFGDRATGSPAETAPLVFGEPAERDLLDGQPILPSADEASDGVSPTPLTAPPAGGGGVPPLTLPIGGEPVPALDAGTGPTQPVPAGPGDFGSSQQSVYENFRQAVQWAEAEQLRGEQMGTEQPGSSPAEAAPEWREPSGRFDASTSYLRRLLDEAPLSFAGQVESDLNVRIRRAEALMRKGEFYNAASEYGIASSLAPDDPLTRLGQGHAYLAAGDYLSAVYHLSQGLERFPEVARFRLDLYEFVSDPNLLDIRRADLEAKLERRADYRLRFLLGYAEYYGGLREFGLDQLRRTAEDAPPGSIIARFPDMLGEQAPAGKAKPGSRR